jgi:hypothetical protein
MTVLSGRQPAKASVEDGTVGPVIASTVGPTIASRAIGGVWGELIGQSAPIVTLQRAVAPEPHAMSYAWLLTGPPGSGTIERDAGLRRSAAMQLGRLREVHRMSYVAVRRASRGHAGAHRAALDRRRRCARAGSPFRHEPDSGRWQVIVIEDADRITEHGADARLRSSRSRSLERCGSCVLRQLTMSWRPSDNCPSDDGRSGAQLGHGSDVEASDVKDPNVAWIRAIEK